MEKILICSKALLKGTELRTVTEFLNFTFASLNVSLLPKPKRLIFKHHETGLVYFPFLM